MTEQRRRSKQYRTLEERLAEQAAQLRAKAKLLPPGPVRDRLIRAARNAEVTWHLSEWLGSPGLRPPT